MAIKVDYVLDKVRLWDNIPQLAADPSNPKPQSAWIRGVIGQTQGSPMGLLLALTYPTTTSTSYQFRYRTKEGTTVGVTLT